MKYLILFSLALFSSVNGFSSIETYCSNSIEELNNVLYTYEIKNGCSQPTDCWIQFKSPEDSISLYLNQEIVFSTNGNYVSNEFFLLPFKIKSNDIIAIKAKDLNQNFKYPKKNCIKIGTNSQLRWQNAVGWFLRTGSNLFSAYFLFIITILLLFSFWLRKSNLGFSLLLYSIVSTAYLISFSEYPRAILDPVFATGALHFPLRLLQDFCLVIVFYNFYQLNDSNGIMKKLSIVYGTVIGIYLLLIAIGVRGYVYYERIIIIMAPLVATPMAIGAWFSLKTKDSIERRVMVPTSFILLSFQVNDLLVFWGLLNSYFTVRLYIPILVGMLLFLYFRRMHIEAIEAQKIQDKQKIFKEFLHDVKSPLAVLRIFFSTLKESPERQLIVQSAFDRIEGMVTQVDSPIKIYENQKVSITNIILETIAQKKIELPDLDITINESIQIFTYADKAKVGSIVSNIINNSYEAYSIGPKSLQISVHQGANEVLILFSDKGKGIDTETISKLFKTNITTKQNGTGIGLISAKQYLQQIGGDLEVISKKNSGTTIKLFLKTITPDLNETDLSQKSETTIPRSLDYIFIDDDKYIRLAWEYHAKNTNKTILTFPNLNEFFNCADKINKECKIYLDLNINGEKSTQYLDKITQLGFKNIFLATGESDLEFPHSSIHTIRNKLPPLQ